MQGENISDVQRDHCTTAFKSLMNMFSANHMSPNPWWFVNGPSGPANLYYIPTPQPSPLFTPSPVYSPDSEPEQ